MCCATSEIKHCVIVMVHWVFTFIVFVGDESLSLVPAHLPHLRLLSLEDCESVYYNYIYLIMAALPELVVVNRWGVILGEMRGGMRIKHLTGRFELITSDGYDILRQWALDR
jgi:hypothetical protein